MSLFLYQSKRKVKAFFWAEIRPTERIFLAMLALVVAVTVFFFFFQGTWKTVLPLDQSSKHQ